MKPHRSSIRLLLAIAVGLARLRYSVIETSGQKTYTIQASDLDLSEGYSSTDHIKILIVAADDRGVFQSGGAFNYFSQLVGFSDEETGFNP